MAVKIYHGDILFTPAADQLSVYENSYIIVEDGVVSQICERVPEEYKGAEVVDYGDKLIIPAFSDLHVHGAQYVQRGIGMDCLLSDWLNHYTFPQESRFRDMDYAKDCIVEGAKASLKFDKHVIELPEEKAKKLVDGGYAGKKVVLGIRPEDISDDPEVIEKAGDNTVDVEITGYELLGAEVLLYYTIAGANMTARVASNTPARMGDKVKLAFDPKKIHVFDKETELTITN